MPLEIGSLSIIPITATLHICALSATLVNLVLCINSRGSVRQPAYSVKLKTGDTPKLVRALEMVEQG